jgi:hypothetical protein
MSLYSNIFNKNRVDLNTAVKQSQTWFQQQSLLLGRQRIIPLQLIKSEPQRNVNRIIPGEMYLFAYDAKTKDTLPYWDMFPLVFPFKKLKDGFIGLNMHYLPYAMRVRLLDRLMDFKTNSLLNDTTRLRYSWSTIQGVSRFKMAEPCVHRYLTDHIQSPLKKIDSNDWATALLLPVERFVGASKQRVWTESLK